MGLGGPAGRFLLLQQLPTGVDVAIRGGRFGLQNPVSRLGETEFSAVVSAYCYSIFENTYFSSPVYGNGKFVIGNVI